MARHGVLPSKISAFRCHLVGYRLPEEQAKDRSDEVGERLVLRHPPRTAMRIQEDRKNRLKIPDCI